MYCTYNCCCCIIDCCCAAERLGLPYVPPYLGPPFAFPSPADSDGFCQGADFAVAAATALDVEFFRERGIPGVPTIKFPLNTSLDVQLEWFESLKPSLCHKTQGTMSSCFSVCDNTQASRNTIQLGAHRSMRAECRKVLGRRSLFIVGEFGVNDYLLSFRRKSVPETRSYVPDVIRTITMGIEVRACTLVCISLDQ